MGTVFTTWMASPLKDRVINLGIILLSIILLLYLIIKWLSPLLQRLYIDKQDKHWRIKLRPQHNSAEELIQSQGNRILELQSEIKNTNEKITELVMKEEKRKIEEEIVEKQYVPLDQHDVFFNLKKYIETGVNLNYDQYNPYSVLKGRIGKIFLEGCKFPVYFRGLKEFIAQVSLLSEECDVSDLLYDIPNLIYKWNIEYMNAAKEIIVPSFNGRIIRGIPEPFLRKFEKWDEPHVHTLLTKIHSILYSNFYKSCYLKLIIILDQIDTAFLLTILDAERTLVELNGDLDEAIKKAGG